MSLTKLRLDLYDKRFSVYENALDFFQALSGSKETMETEKFQELRRRFIKSYRESQFLFDDDSGVFKLLEQMNLDSFKITGAKTTAREMPGEMAFKMVTDANAAYSAIDRTVEQLERAIAPYIRFKRTLV